MPENQYLPVGKFVGVRGLNGELKVDSWMDNPDDFCKLKNIFIKKNNQNILVNIINYRYHKSHILVKLKNICDRTGADEFVNHEIYAHRDNIPKNSDRYFIQDLINCQVIDFSSNKIYGVLSNIFNTGANDIYVIKNNNKEYLVPIIPGTVKDINLDHNKIYISPISGIFDE
ncbi:MAG: 16S rRNA processing protein RimM [Clostridia bacterium]|nr:16S rRNA processing protein RimM [Clostridia bacterium]MBQ3093311.1 16S rRNA processing protein RimM [Clostridia bacterium]